MFSVLHGLGNRRVQYHVMCGDGKMVSTCLLLFDLTAAVQPGSVAQPCLCTARESNMSGERGGSEGDAPMLCHCRCSGAKKGLLYCC